jgi:RNA polymerase sigma factor (sigma-70 family)
MRIAGTTRNAVLLRDVQSLFNLGVVRDLSDHRLLDQFLAADQGQAEVAFTLLVERHGPMVLHVCQQLLGDSHDAQDAFQATFLVFLSRARSIRNRGSVASWLFGVAMRVARRARYTAIVRRFHEQEAGKFAIARGKATSEHSQRLAALHEEIARLPQRYREPIVLCHLEGLSTTAAAQRLGCAPGTILSRLARGRERLRGRLTQRGRVGFAGLFAEGRLPQEATAAVPTGLVNATVQAAVRALAGRSASTAITSPAGLALAQATQGTLFMTRMLLVGTALATTVVVTALNVRLADPARSAGPQAAATDKGTPGLEEKPRPIEKSTIQSRDLEDALYKILRRDRKFDDPRWPFAVKVGDVQDKSLIDVRIIHRTKEKPGEFDAVIQAKRAVVRVDTVANVVRLSLEQSEVQKFGPGGDVIQVENDVLEFPIPPGGLLAEQGLPAPAEARPESQIVANNRQALSLVYSSDGKTLATAGFDGVVHLWDMIKAEPISHLTGEKSTTRSVAFAPDGTTVACVNDAGLVRLWDVASGKLKQTLPGLSESMRQAAHTFMLDAIAFAPDGRLLAVSGFGPTRADTADRFYELRVFDLEAGQSIWSHMGRGEQACSLAFAPDGATLARAGLKTVKLWDAKTGEPVRTLTPTKGTIFAIAFTPDGRTLVGGGNIPTNDVNHQAGLITLWNLMTGQIIHTLEGHTGGVHAVAVTRDGKLVASGGDGHGRLSDLGSPSEVRLWDIATGKLVWTVDGEQGVVRGLAFAPDGKTLVYADDRAIGRIDVLTGRIERALTKF